MLLADYVLERLRDAGVRKVFVVYGAACGDLVDAFSRVKGIDYVAVMHEQAGAFAAETYTKVSGDLSACIATSGPGGTNLLTGIANCYYDSVPVIFITGQVNSKFLKQSHQQRQVGFQENDIVAMARPITKMARRVNSPAWIRDILDEAFVQATGYLLGPVGERPGPVLLDIPADVQKENVDIPPFCFPPRWRAFPDAQTKAEQFLADFLKAKRPVLLAGGGVRSSFAVAAIRALGEELQLPCLPTWNAIDIFTSDYSMYRGRVGTYGGPGRNFAIQNADLLLCIGTRLSGRITGGYVEAFARGARKYIVDIDAGLLRGELQAVKGDVNILCDAGCFIESLAWLVDHTSFRHREQENSEVRSWWLEKTLEWRDRYQPAQPQMWGETEFVHPYVFMEVLSEELGHSDVVVSDCGGNAVVTFQALKTKYGQRVVSSHGNSPMGYSFAGAMGACFIPREQRVVCLIGDGGFNMNIQELQTIKSYNLPLKTFIMNNHCYGITRQFQRTNYGGRYLACGPDGYSPPDFVKVVEAYGIDAETIFDHRDLRQRIRRVLDHPGAIVCDVNMGLFSDYQPRIFGWRTPIEDMFPYISREEFRANMLIDPVEGWESPAMPGGLP